MLHPVQSWFGGGESDAVAATAGVRSDLAAADAAADERQRLHDAFKQLWNEDNVIQVWLLSSTHCYLNFNFNSNLVEPMCCLLMNPGTCTAQIFPAAMLTRWHKASCALWHIKGGHRRMQLLRSVLSACCTGVGSFRMCLKHVLMWARICSLRQCSHQLNCCCLSATSRSGMPQWGPFQFLAV